MNQEISGISSAQKLTSKARVSLDKGESVKEVAAPKSTTMQQEMEQINHAFTLVQEIRHSLEQALNNLE